MIVLDTNIFSEWMRPISDFDAQIAAIARSAGATIAPRDVTDYNACGVEVTNPREY